MVVAGSVCGRFTPSYEIQGEEIAPLLPVDLARSTWCSCVSAIFPRRGRHQGWPSGKAGGSGLPKDGITWQLICTHLQIMLPLHLLIVETKCELESSVLCTQNILMQLGVVSLRKEQPLR